MAQQLWLLRHGEAEPHDTRPDPDSLSVSFIAHVTRDVQTSDTFIRIGDVSETALKSHE